MFRTVVWLLSALDKDPNNDALKMILALCSLALPAPHVSAPVGPFDCVYSG